MRTSRAFAAFASALAMTLGLVVPVASPATAASATVSISVTVTSASGALASGCVKIVSASSEFTDCTATAAGTYSFSGLARTGYEVTVYGFAGYQDVTLPDKVNISSYEDSFATTVKLKLFGIVKGRVLSTTGDPIVDAPVTLRGGPGEGPFHELTTTTDAGGYYRFDVPIDGTYSPRVGPVKNYGSWPAEGSVQSGIIVKAGTTATYQTITMAPGGTVTGTLVAPPGIDATTVCASVHLASNAQARGSACGSPGDAFTIAEVPLGKYFVCLSAEVAPQTCAADAPGVTERVGMPDNPINPYPSRQFLQVTTGATVPYDVVWGGTVTANVKLDTGAILEGGCLRMEVAARGLDVTSCAGAAGAFVFDVPMDLENASVAWTLTGAANAEDGAWTRAQSAFLGGTFSTTLAASAKGDASVAVSTTGDDATPLAAGCVHLWTNAAQPLKIASSCEGGGAHVFDDLGPGTYAVSVTDVPSGFTQWWYPGASGAIAVAQWITVAAGEHVELPLAVPTSHLLTGTVRDQNGAPLSGGMIQFIDSSGEVAATAPVSAGEYELVTPVAPGHLRAVGFDGFADTYLGGYYAPTSPAPTGPAKPRATSGNDFVLRASATFVGTLVAPPRFASDPVCIQLRQSNGFSFGPALCGEAGDAFAIPVIQGQSYWVCVRPASGGVCQQYGSTAELVGQTTAPTAFTAASAGPNPLEYVFGGTRVVTVTVPGSGQPALEGCITHLVGTKVVAQGCVDENGVAELTYAEDIDWTYGTLRLSGFRNALDRDIDAYQDGVTNGETVPLAVQVQPWRSVNGTITRPTGFAQTHACVMATNLTTIFAEQCLEPGTSAYSLPLAPGDYLLQFYTVESGVAYEWYNNKPTLSGAEWITIDAWDDVTANATLAPGGRIVGVLRTADGAPATEGCAKAYAVDGSGAQIDCVDSQGRYALESLSPGTYKVEFTAVPGHGLAWYGGAATFAGAAKITVAAGATSTANVTLAPAVRLHGTVTLGGEPALGGCVTAYALTGDIVTTACVDEAGAYEFSDLPGGKFKVLFEGFDGAADAWAGGSKTYAKAASYSFAAGALATLNGALGVGSTISGDWDSYSGSTHNPATVYLYELDGTLVAWTRAEADDWYHLSYEFDHVPAGKYELAISTDGSSYSEYYRPSGSLTPAVITVPSGAPTNVTGIIFNAFAPDSEQEQGELHGRLNVPSTWSSSTVCAVAVSASGSPIVGDCGPKGGYFEIPDLNPDAYFKLVFTNGEVRTAAQFKSFTGTKRYYGNTTSVSAAPSYAVANYASNYLPVWFFSDVNYKTSKFEAVQWMGAEGISTGYSDGTFKPSSSLSRRSFAIFLYKAAGSPAVTLPAKSPFVDVPKSDSAYKALLWMRSRKIWTSTTFSPSSAVDKRIEALLLYRAAGSPAVTVPSKNPFTDIKTTDVAYKAVIWANKYKIVPKSSSTKYGTATKLTRGSGAASLYEWWWRFG